MTKKIAILTSGGDSPGMNATIIAITRSALAKGFEVKYVMEGYKGLYNNQILDHKDKRFANYLNIGGTFLYSARFPEFKDEEVRKVAVENLKRNNIDVLIVIGGDGSYKGALALEKMGVNVLTLPGTIDNDINSTEYTIGYDTALNTIVEAVDRLRNTSQSHERIMLVEVMGRGNADLAIFGGMATGAELIITKDNKMNVEEITNHILDIKKEGGRSIIVIISEKVYTDINELAKNIQEKTGIQTRPNILAHMQRGGSPSAADRTRAWRMGNYASELVEDNDFGYAIGILDGKVHKERLDSAIGETATPRLVLLNKLNLQNKLLKKD